MFDSGQHQTVGNKSTVLQSGNDLTIHVGLSYSEAREIALDVSKATFHELSGEARNLMLERVEEITDRVIQRIAEEHPVGLDKAKDPDFQHALLVVQREYGRCGDAELGNLLADLIVERSKVETRSLRQIVLNESLSITPKLTPPQIATLSLLFMLRHTTSNEALSHEKLGIFFDTCLKPFADNLCTQEYDYQHLSFTGCGTNQMLQTELPNLLLDSYAGLFLKGLTDNDIHALPVSDELKSSIFMKCLADNTKAQYAFLKISALFEFLQSKGASHTETETIASSYNNCRLSPTEVGEICVKIRPYMAELIAKWDNSPAPLFTLTSVGMAIAHANIKRIIPSFANLSTWIA